MPIQILGWPMGNPRSVYNMLNYINMESVIVDNPNGLNSSLPLIIPGVGSFDHASYLLDTNGWRDPINSIIFSGQTVLGICLGMQILCKSSEEGPGNGLGVFNLHLKKFRDDEVKHCPRMGWSEISFLHNSWEHLNVNQFYFTHSYRVDPSTDFSVAHTSSNRPYTCILKKDSVWGVQFHPEKSHSFGMRLFRHIFAQ